jgi:hypothetical protein
MEPGMSTNYPGALDNGTSLPNPTAGSYQDTLSHAAQHGNANDSIKAIEAKLGIGASAPSSNTILLGTGTGTSAFSQLTSAQIRAILTDPSGTGAAVFANTPTLITPKVDTINEATANNGVTVDGVVLKDGGATFIGPMVHPNNSIPAAALSTSAITLGYTSTTTAFSTASTTPVQVTGLTVTVTIPSGGRRIKITVFARGVYNSAAGYQTVSIWDGTVGTGTKLSDSVAYISIGAAEQPASVISVQSPASGSKTYNVGFQVTAGTGTVDASTTAPAFILVEAI